MTNTRLAPKDRRAQILQSALQVAEKNDRFTVDDVAKSAGITVPLIFHYFGTKTKLLRAVMRAAVEQENVPIVARGLVLGDPHARKASPELRAKATEYLTERAAK